MPSAVFAAKAITGANTHNIVRVKAEMFFFIDTPCGLKNHSVRIPVACAENSGDTAGIAEGIYIVIVYNANRKYL